METALIAVTLMSLAMAVAMSVVAWRLVREERRRSAARVAALADLAARDELGDDFFATPASPGGSGRTMALTAASLLAVAIVTALALASRETTRGAAGAGAAATAPVRPLELLSLRHSTTGGELAISGLVRNPGDGGELRNVTVVAFVFDQAGSPIASGRATLEVVRLAPGAESPFSIAVAGASAAGRYRIGFRTEDGGVLGHVDRRTLPATGAPERARPTMTQAGLTAGH